MGKSKQGKATKTAPSGITNICQNRRARHDYEITDKLEAGLVLVGTEVKSCRAQKAHLNEAYVGIKNGEAYLVGGHIAEYAQGNQFNHEPQRDRKLLLKRHEIDKLQAQVQRQGYTAIPLSMYFKNGYAKLQVGIARGKKEIDRRESLKKKQTEREMERALRRRNR